MKAISSKQRNNSQEKSLCSFPQILKLPVKVNRASIRYEGGGNLPAKKADWSDGTEETTEGIGLNLGKWWQSSENIVLPETLAARCPTNHDLFSRHRLVSFCHDGPLASQLRCSIPIVQEDWSEAAERMRCPWGGRMQAWSQTTDICFSMLPSNSKKQSCNINPLLRTVKPFVCVAPSPQNENF